MLQSAARNPIEQEVAALLVAAGKRLALAESTTGGLIGHRFTDLPGCSAYFLGGIVAYSNRVKREVLGVSQETLTGHGGVSAEAALEMARGALRLLKADVAVSETGVAGPTGGTAGKPVGTFFIALADDDGTETVREYRFNGTREENKLQSARAALGLLKEHLARKAGKQGGA